MFTSEFDYYLPKELIAQKPLKKRDDSRLLFFSQEKNVLQHNLFKNIDSYLSENDLLVLNDTKVIPARLLGKSESYKGFIEIFLLKELENHSWEVLTKPGKKTKKGIKVFFAEDFFCTIEDINEHGTRTVVFNDGMLNKEEFFKRLKLYGKVPLPPYIENVDTSLERYQTVYANSNYEKSVAAPTAGLHFTDDLLCKIRERGIKIVYVTLNVGLGTFKPVMAEDLSAHIMHKEYYVLKQEVADIIMAAKDKGKNIVAVGTTVVRVLESVAQKNNGRLVGETGWTDIFIYPPYDFKIISSLITNFHLPKSTLLMLVSAFLGMEKTKELYNEAIEKCYRFFSFGDAMFLKR